MRACVLIFFLRYVLHTLTHTLTHKHTQIVSSLVRHFSLECCGGSVAE